MAAIVSQGFESARENERAFGSKESGARFAKVTEKNIRNIQSLPHAKINGDEAAIKKLLAHIDELIENAIIFDTKISNTKKGLTSFMHDLYCPVEYNGAPFIARIVVEEYDVDGKKQAYNAQRIKMSSLPRAHFNVLNQQAKTRNIRLQDDEITIADLHTLVNHFYKNSILLNPAKL